MPKMYFLGIVKKWRCSTLLALKKQYNTNNIYDIYVFCAIYELVHFLQIVLDLLFMLFYNGIRTRTRPQETRKPANNGAIIKQTPKAPGTGPVGYTTRPKTGP